MFLSKKVKLPSRKNRTAPDFNPMTPERFIKELVYPWSAEIDDREFLRLSFAGKEKASILPGADCWLFSSNDSIYSIDIPLMQKMLALAKYENTGRQYVLVNGKAKNDGNGEKFWHIFILGEDDLQTMVAFEDELQNYSYSREQLKRFADRYPNKLRAAVDTLAVPLDEVLAKEKQQ